MGWKGQLRSLSAVSNAANREHERRRKKEEQEFQKLSKKHEKIESARNKILEVVKKDYAAGKINKERFDELEKRMDDITIDLLIFGKSAGVTLGKRYLCGKIKKDEFEKVKLDLIPPDLVKEREAVNAEIEEKQETKRIFEEMCSEKEKACFKCGKKKGFLSPLFKVGDFRLCGKCSNEYKKLKQYQGHNGVYFTCEPSLIEEGMTLGLVLKNEWL